jgi:phytoene dehydrogenase-like protein
MGESDGTVDKIYLVYPDGTVADPRLYPFKMKYKEEHRKDLYALFPDDKQALDEFMTVSDNSMMFVKIFFAMRLLPKWLQEFCWYYLVPKRYIDPVSITAKDLLPKLTKNKLLCSLLSSMWIDTGARPDKASFMLTAAVFRGISLEGGVYPSGGSEAMALELASTLHANQGRIFVRAVVETIIVNSGKAVGVIMQDECQTQIIAKKGIVSSVGYKNTFSKLVTEEVCSGLSIPRELPIAQSAGEQFF